MLIRLRLQDVRAITPVQKREILRHVLETIALQFRVVIGESVALGARYKTLPPLKSSLSRIAF